MPDDTFVTAYRCTECRLAIYVNEKYLDEGLPEAKQMGERHDRSHEGGNDEPQPAARR